MGGVRVAIFFQWKICFLAFMFNSLNIPISYV